ncbi:MAG TPA: hypothetical protein VGS12_10310, partial [Caulobacteraceae bacterium]|nr:hypothetical protein [Caulobacteraceae bacterium]
GETQASADTSSGLVTDLSAQAQAPTTAAGASALALAGAATPPAPSATANVYALATAAPSPSFVAAVLATNPLLDAVSSGATITGLGSADAAILAAGTEGALVPASAAGGDYVATETLTLDASALSGHLIIGLTGAQATGSAGDTNDFSSLTFTVTVDGTTVATDTFASLSAAQAFFADNPIDAGAFASAGGLKVQVSLDVTSATAGFGFSGQFVVGVTDGHAPPVVTAPAYVDAIKGKSIALGGVSVSEATPLGAGQTVTVTLADTAGLLSETAGQGAVTGNGTTTLSLTGTTAQVNADLATLSYASASGVSEVITLSTSDSRTGVGAPAVIAVVDPFWFTRRKDHFQGGAGNDLFIATDGTLNNGDWADGGGGINTLRLQGGGVFDLSAPDRLANIQVIDAQEGQPWYHAGPLKIDATDQTVILRDGMNGVTVNVLAATINPANPLGARITIIGANNNDVINLGAGHDTVVLGSAAETVHGGTGVATIEVDRKTIGATIDGGSSGRSTLEVKGGGAVTMGANITDIATVVIDKACHAASFTANAIAGLVVDDLNVGFADTLTAGAAGQTLEGGGPGAETFVGFGSGATTYADKAWLLNGDAIENFNPSDRIDVTGFAFGPDVRVTWTAPTAWSAGVLTLWEGKRAVDKVTLFGQVAAAGFTVQSDGAGGTLILDAPLVAGPQAVIHPH